MAGASSGWHKPSTGPLAGKKVFIPPSAVQAAGSDRASIEHGLETNDPSVISKIQMPKGVAKQAKPLTYKPYEVDVEPPPVTPQAVKEIRATEAPETPPEPLFNRTAFRAANPRRIELNTRGDEVIVYSPYDAGNVQIMRQLGGQFNKNQIKGDNGWYFPIDRFEEVAKALPTFKPEPTLTQRFEAQEAKRLAEQAAIATTMQELLRLAQVDHPLPSGRELKDHQKEAVAFLLGRPEGRILADDMGLGKTTSSLVAAKAYQQLYGCKVIVLAPKSVIGSWEHEAQGAGVDAEIYSWGKLPDEIEGDYVLIADEALFAQDPNSKRSKAMVALAHNAKTSFLLSGTPMKNSPINVYPLLKAIQAPIAANQRYFEKRYCNAQERYAGGRRFWDTSGSSRLDELQAQTADLILRRKKSDIPSLGIPPKTRSKIEVSLPPAEEKAYRERLRELAKAYQARVESGEIEGEGHALVALSHLRSAGSVAKVSASVEQAKAILDTDQPVIIFTEFVESARELQQALGGELLIGDVSTQERTAMVQRFQEGKSKVFISSIKAGGVGITLTASSYVIMHDRPWTAADVDQAEDRSCRMGQTAPVVNSYWMNYGDVDVLMNAVVEQKAEQAEKVLKRRSRKNAKPIHQMSVTEIAHEFLMSFK